MTIAAKLKEFLDNNNVQYSVLTHPEAFTAQELAAVAHVRGKELAKSVVVKADDRLVLAVLPAPRKIDLNRLSEAVGAREVRLAHESEFGSVFPGCELGAMPPSGNLFGLEIVVDESLTRDAEIVFHACTHTEAIRMKYEDFQRLAKPTISDFSIAN